MGGLDPGDESCEPNEAIFRGLSLILCCRVTPQPGLCDLRKARYCSFYLLECVLSRAKVSSVLFTVNSQVCKKQSKTKMLRYVNVSGPPALVCLPPYVWGKQERMWCHKEATGVRLDGCSEPAVSLGVL